MSPASPIEMSLGQAVVATFAVTCDGGEADERAGADAAPFLIDLSDDRLTVEAAGTLLGRQGTRYDVIKSPLTMAAIEKRTLCQACSLDDYEWEKQAAALSNCSGHRRRAPDRPDRHCEALGHIPGAPLNRQQLDLRELQGEEVDHRTHFRGKQAA
jgi:hypothetical protein